MKTEHTPTPKWEWRQARTMMHLYRDGVHTGISAPMNNPGYPRESLNAIAGHAREVYTACNSYDALVDALRNVLDGLRLGRGDDSPYWDATIANAESALKAAGVEL